VTDTLNVSHPELARQLGVAALGLVLTAGSSRKVAWRCDVGHSWDAPVYSRADGNGCPICANKVTLAGWNDLATTHPQLVGDLVRPSEAESVIAGSDRVLEWVCRRLHPEYRWFGSVKKRALRGQGCAVCAGKAVLHGWNDLATTHPELTPHLLDPAAAMLVSFGTNTKLSWSCSVGHPPFVWEQIPWKRAEAVHSCPVCAGKRILMGHNDLETTHPALAATLADSAAGRGVSAGSDVRALWRCDGPHGRFTWQATVSSRAGQGIGCPACSGKVVVAGWNDLATTHPDLSRQLVEPAVSRQVSAGAAVKVLWFCETGHSHHRWLTTVASRALNGSGCGVCANRIVIVGHNDLATTRPDLAARLTDPADARRVTSGSDRRLQWFCQDGHRRFEWAATPASRIVTPTGCPRCSRGGFDQGRPGYLYLLARTAGGEDQRQYGITGNLAARMATHLRVGWVLLDYRRFDDGSEAMAAETAIKRAMRCAGFYGTVPPDGTYRNVEAWFAGELPEPVDSLDALMSWSESTSSSNHTAASRPAAPRVPPARARLRGPRPAVRI
jgi:hypothetical protein